MVIRLDSMTGADLIREDVPDTIYTYVVDVSPGETVTLKGDFNLVTGGDVFIQEGLIISPTSYFLNGPEPGWGTFSLGPTTGTLSFSFTADELAANGGNQVVSLMVLGVNNSLGPDVDVVNIEISCFGIGTAIATPSGSTAVEALRIGDPVLTHDGRTVAVKWIGRQTVSTLFGPAERLMPVRVRAGALGGGLPLRDLTLTADHALLVDGLLINAGALVNGTTIVNVPLPEMGERFTVYHVETEAHDIILAEGAPAESFIDYVGRQAFDNHAEYVALYGEERIIPELPQPRISTARLVPPAIRARLAGLCAA